VSNADVTVFGHFQCGDISRIPHAWRMPTCRRVFCSFLFDLARGLGRVWFSQAVSHILYIFRCKISNTIWLGILWINLKETHPLCSRAARGGFSAPRPRGGHRLGLRPLVVRGPEGTRLLRLLLKTPDYIFKTPFPSERGRIGHHLPNRFREGFRPPNHGTYLHKYVVFVRMYIHSY
jgi:hypothetical protein